MGTINAAWHKTHPMPKNPTTEQRIDWHIKHAAHCACREIPPSLQKEIALNRKKKVNKERC